MVSICATPLVEGDRLWFVTSRGEVRCLDTEGFHDGDNDGPYQDEKFNTPDEADVVWDFDMMKELGISQHNMCSCSVTDAGNLLFVNTSNGVDVEHNYIPAPEAPSFFVMDNSTNSARLAGAFFCSPCKNHANICISGNLADSRHLTAGGRSRIGEL